MQRRTVRTIIIAICAASLIFACRKKGGDDEEGKAIKTPSRIIIQDNERVIVIDKATQAKSAIVTAALQPHSQWQEIRAYGVVVDLQELISLRNNYSVAKSESERALANLDASRKAYERQKVLYEDNRNTSAKELQSVQATFHSNEAELKSARAAMEALESAARQQWGEAILKWVLDASQSFDRLVKFQDVLIQMTIPKDAAMTAVPQTARLLMPNGKIIAAQFVSMSHRTDPRIQGKIYFYIAPNEGMDLLAGMNMPVNLPAGPQVEGVIIPSSAVVWWQGKAWAYLQKEPEKFVRREIPVGTPVQDGWFVTKALSAQDTVVIQGAQMLLSEEFRTQAQDSEE